MNHKGNAKKGNNSNNNSNQANTPKVPIDNRLDQTNRNIEETKSQAPQKKEDFKEKETDKPKIKKARWFNNSKGWGNFFNFCLVGITFVSGIIIIKHFEITNKPNLQFTSFKIDTFEVGKPIVFHYELANIGNYPVKLDSTKFVVNIRKAIPKYEEVLSEFQNEGVEAPNTIVSKEFPLTRSQVILQPVTIGQSSIVYQSGYYVFITGYFDYVNLSNNKKNRYRFQIQTTPYWDKNGFNFIINDNSKFD